MNIKAKNVGWRWHIEKKKKPKKPKKKREKRTKINTRKPRIVEKSLPEKIWGYCYMDGEDLIELDPQKLKRSKDYLDTLIHEMLHHHFPQTPEESVEEIGTLMAEALWRKRFRRLEKH